MAGGRCSSDVAPRAAHGSPSSGPLPPTRAVDQQRRVPGALPARQTDRPAGAHRALARGRRADARRVRRESPAQDRRATESGPPPAARSLSGQARDRTGPDRAGDRRPASRTDRALRRLGRTAPGRAGRDSRRPRGAMSASAIAAAAIGAYQRLVSPLLPRACRFAPTCSEYARQALLEQGLVRGLWLALRRVARCHPFHPGGYDPPPVRERPTS